MSDLCIWITGLPSSGKTTLALGLEKALRLRGLRPVVLDGDTLRNTLFPDLRYSRVDRTTQGHRATYLAKLIQQAGGVPIVALISPYKDDRAWARHELKGFVEVYLACPASVCAERDPKGLWGKAMRGDISQFTGHDDPYEVPDSPEVIVRTDLYGPERCVELVMDGINWKDWDTSKAVPL